ncbi:unnamed protein product [Prunus armeniaca]|uniref:Uncharacterized protein n=1 Tax=Prunus armeniaca TaxID=36596 RepID=A0A6J5U0M5_PRUAR|nr:unnamed protein product [Prunus armeniaca]
MLLRLEMCQDQFQHQNMRCGRANTFYAIIDIEFIKLNSEGARRTQLMVTIHTSQGPPFI